MKNVNGSKMAKILLAEQNVKVFQKDIERVNIRSINTVKHELAGGTIAPDYFSHKEEITIQLKNGTAYKLYRETVDENGNFSTGSAKFVTKKMEVA